MDNTIFDAITVLLYAAEQDGFTSSDDALELVLDVYLLEREQMYPSIPVFRSKRAETMRAIDDWTDDLVQDATPEAAIGWSMNIFPLMHAS
ncbi:MAG: hypothetical protein ACI80I_001570 [Akkermansiaceae bacterium]|jgi:hypothetical protein